MAHVCTAAGKSVWHLFQNFHTKVKFNHGDKESQAQNSKGANSLTQIQT